MEVIKGRMYDYNNGRFLSVDPFIQDPSSTQSMNPYTYIFNNPLSGTDPTGYAAWIFRLPAIGRGIGTGLAKTAEFFAKKATSKKLKQRALRKQARRIAKQNARTKQKASKLQRKQREKATKQREAKKAENKNGNTNKETGSKPKNEKSTSDIGSEKGKRAGQNGVEGPVKQKNSMAGKHGEKGPRIKKEYPDGSKKDITRQNVKEKVPNSRAPNGESRVKFDKKDRTDTHRSDPHKRKPTTKELKELDKVDKK